MRRRDSVRVVAILGCAGLLCSSFSLAEREDRRLMKGAWRSGAVEELRAMTPADIKSIQIFDLTEDGKKVYREHAVTTERNKAQIEAFLHLIRAAKPFSVPEGVPLAIGGSDRALVIEPKDGAPFEYRYNSHPGQPFAGLHSRALKEALHALAGKAFPITIIHLKDGKVHEVLHASLPAPHRGGVGGGRVSAELHLTRTVGISLWVEIIRNGEAVLEAELPMHFGDARVYAAGEKGTFLVLLH